MAWSIVRGACACACAYAVENVEKREKWINVTLSCLATSASVKEKSGVRMHVRRKAGGV